MVDLIKWKPFSRLMKGFFDDFSPLFEHERSVLSRDLDFVPRMDIKNADEELQVTLDIPGMDKKDLEVTIDDGIDLSG